MFLLNKKALIIFLVYLVKISSCKKNKIFELDESSWTDLLTDEWMVQFYAPWCPSCKNLKSTWEEFSNSDNIKVASIDVTKNPGLSGRFLISALPTIYHVKTGSFRQYVGNRDINSLLSFIDEKKWKSIEPKSSWLHPSSYLMSAVSWLFKVSMAIRDIHNRAVDDYGIPAWVSYVILGFGVILFGTILGLILVCVFDVMILPMKEKNIRNSKEKNFFEDKKFDDNDEDELLTKDDSDNDSDNKHKTKETKKSL